MTNWRTTVNVADVFHDETKTFEERRDTIVNRFRSRFGSRDDELTTILEDLSVASDVDEFDARWDDLYDWADNELVWVATF